MDFIQRLVHYFAVVRRQMRRHRRAVLTCAAVVVFATTYALVLPAITLDKDEAEQTPGISLEHAAQEDTQDASADMASEEEQSAEGASTDAEATTATEQVTEDASEGAAGGQQADAATDSIPSDDENAEAQSGADNTLTYQGNGYSFTIEYDADSGIPEGSSLRVTEVTGSDYDSYKQKTNDLVYGKGGQPSEAGETAEPEETEQHSVTFARYFDVTILSADGNEVEPTKPVRVTAAVDGSDAITGDVNVLHFEDGGDVESIPAEREADGTLSYEQGSFSVVGVYRAPQVTSDEGASATGTVSALAAAADATTTDVTSPSHSKTLTDNHDGTYDLTLSVTGASSSSTSTNKADVIIVFDTSSSMNSLVESDTGSLGLYNDTYYYLYRRDRYSYSYTQISDSDYYSGDVYIKYGNNYYQFSGQRYLNQSRLDVAKEAIAGTNGLVNQLLANNSANATVDNASVTLSLVTFDTTATTQNFGSWYSSSVRTVNASDVNDIINNISIKRGQQTNWQDALAKEKAITAREGATRYVIFVSDGNPSRYGSAGTGGTGSDTNEQNVTLCYNQALNEFQGYSDPNFYGVGVFGNVNRMQGLVQAAGADTTTHYQTATDSTSLNAAFANIINSIKHAADFRNVVMTDNLTDMTSTALANTNGTLDSSTYTVKVTDKDNNDVTSTEQADGLGSPSYDASSKKVTWTMGQNYQLKDGYTYSVTFRVWPSQEAYDLNADLMNGTKDYAESSTNSITNEQRAQIAQGSNGSYSLYSNVGTDDTITYTRVETTTDSSGNQHETTTDGTGTFDRPNPMVLNNGQVTISKSFSGGTPSMDGLILTLRQDGSNYLTTSGAGGSVGTLTLNNSNGTFSGTAYVAPGLIQTGTGEGGTGYTVLDAGHDYTFTEDGDASKNWNLSGDTYHPMVIGTQLTMLKKVNAKPESGPAYQIGDSWYVPVDNGSTTMTATNTASTIGITIKKVASDSNGHLTDTALTGVTFTLTKQGSKGTDGNYTYTVDSNVKTLEPDGSFTISKNDGISLTGLTAGVYKLTETSAPAGYVVGTSSVYFTVDGGSVKLCNEDGSTENVTNTQADLPNMKDGNIVLRVGNTPGQALPETGGSGTLPYAVAGSALVTTAIVGFALRRKNEGRDGRI